MTTTDTTFDALDTEALRAVNRLAHKQTLHASALSWEEAATGPELAFLSQVVFGEPGYERSAVAYLVKELSQLAEIERHVSAVLAIVLSEVQDGPLGAGTPLHDALSCFAAEELHHANAFHRYARELAGTEFVPPTNLFSERLGVFQGPESPYVKLAALCCTAYIGESIITAFERRTHTIDPELMRFLPRLLHLHNLDEVRHVQTDHWVIDTLIPALSPGDQQSMRELIGTTEKLNFELAGIFEAHAKEAFAVDYTEGNAAHLMQMQLTMAFAQQALGGAAISRMDDAIDEPTRALLERFTGHSSVHV